MRLAHVLGALDYGGVESMALHLIRGLGARGFRSSVYSIGPVVTDRAASFEETSGQELRSCPYDPRRRTRFVRELASRLREDGIEGVLSYSFGNHAWVSLAARWAGATRCYVRVAGSPLRSGAQRRKNRILAHLARPFCNGEIAISHRLREELVRGLGLPRRRVVVIENACDVEGIARRASAARVARASATAAEVIMVARMDDAKDQPTLIRAISSLSRDGIVVRLRLAGTGPREAAHRGLAIELGVSDRVEFLGNRRDVPELLGGSDVAVLSTHSEGFGVVLAEAMSAGVPAIATDVPACREVLEDGRCGLLVPRRDPEALATSIRKLLEDRSLRNRFVARAFERARARYDVSSAVERYARLFGELPPQGG